jgi:hypothetical protein
MIFILSLQRGSSLLARGSVCLTLQWGVRMARSFDFSERGSFDN